SAPPRRAARERERPPLGTVPLTVLLAIGRPVFGRAKRKKLAGKGVRQNRPLRDRPLSPSPPVVGRLRPGRHSPTIAQKFYAAAVAEGSGRQHITAIHDGPIDGRKQQAFVQRQAASRGYLLGF